MPLRCYSPGDVDLGRWIRTEIATDPRPAKASSAGHLRGVRGESLTTQSGRMRDGV